MASTQLQDQREPTQGSSFFLTDQDSPRLWASIAVFGTCMSFGAGLAALGVALPDLAADLHEEPTALSNLFTFRGIGVLLGAVLSAQLLEVGSCCFSKHFICCIAAAVAGAVLCSVVVLSLAPGIGLSYFFVPFLVQGICFGVIDSYSAVAIAEMWGQRQQVWMQVKNTSAAAASVVAPLLLAVGGYRIMCIGVALLCTVAFVGLAGERIVTVQLRMQQQQLIQQQQQQQQRDIEEQQQHQQQQNLQDNLAAAASYQQLSIAEHTDSDHDDNNSSSDDDDDEEMQSLKEQKFQDILQQQQNQLGDDEEQTDSSRTSSSSSPWNESFSSAASSSAVAADTAAAFSDNKQQFRTRSSSSSSNAATAFSKQLMCGKAHNNSALLADEINALSSCLRVLPASRLQSSAHWQQLTGEVLSATLLQQQQQQQEQQQRTRAYSLQPFSVSRKSSVASSEVDATTAAATATTTAVDINNSSSSSRLLQPSPLLSSDRYNNHQQQRLPAAASRPLLQHTLSFADAKIASKARKNNSNFGVTLVPSEVRFALAAFVFWQMSALYVAAGWLSSFIELTGAEIAATTVATVATTAAIAATTTSTTVATAAAASEVGLEVAVDLVQWGEVAVAASSAFYCAQMFGALLSVPLSLYFSTTAMMRSQLLLVAAAVLLLLLQLLLTLPVTFFALSACLLGLGLCSMFPLAMTIVNDYGFTMCSRSTIAIVMGACIGKAVAPILVGKLLADYGAIAFPFFYFATAVALLLLYGYVHTALMQGKNSTAAAAAAVIGPSSSMDYSPASAAVGNSSSSLLQSLRVSAEVQALVRSTQLPFRNGRARRNSSYNNSSYSNSNSNSYSAPPQRGYRSNRSISVSQHPMLPLRARNNYAISSIQKQQEQQLLQRSQITAPMEVPDAVGSNSNYNNSNNNNNSNSSSGIQLQQISCCHSDPLSGDRTASVDGYGALHGT